MRRLFSAIAAVGLIAAGLTCGSATAWADTAMDIFRAAYCQAGAHIDDNWLHGFCDNPAVPTGQHYHCEWGRLGDRSCDWRWDDNTLAPPPPPAELTFGSHPAQADCNNPVFPPGSWSAHPYQAMQQRVAINCFIVANCRDGAHIFTDTDINGFCDNPAVPTGQHYHCEWGPYGIRPCDWRWDDNTLAPPPADNPLPPPA